MDKITTKYFGEIVIDELVEWTVVDVNINEQKISITFNGLLSKNRLNEKK